MLIWQKNCQIVDKKFCRMTIGQTPLFGNLMWLKIRGLHSEIHSAWHSSEGDSFDI